jgi:signal transduction histidine kinase/ActR/RegA family two-component response regulator
MTTVPSDAGDARPPGTSGRTPTHAPADGHQRASLRRLLFSITVISGTVYAAFWTAWTWDHHNDERRRAEIVVERNLDRATSGFAGFLAERTAAAAEAAAAIDPAAPGRPACALPSIPVIPGDAPIERYDLVRPDGSVECSTAVGPAGELPPPARGAPWLEAGYRPGSPSDDYVDAVTGATAWGVAFPVGSGGDTGILAAVVQLTPASEQLGAFFGDGLGTAYVVSDADSGEVLSRPAGTSWTAERPGRHIVFTRRVPGTDWHLSAGVDRSVAYAETWDEVKGGALALLAAMAALSLLTALVYRRIVRPLGDITAAARSAAGGGATSLDESGPAELAELARELNELTASRARSENLLTVTAERLGHSVERLDAVLANSADMVLIVDGEGKVTFASPAAAAVCAPIVVPGVELTSLVHPDDVGKAAALVRRGASTDANVELRLGSHGCGWRHVDMVARDLLDHPAVRGVIINGRDVTDRLAEAAERAVLDEQLHQSQRLESLGALAGGIAHDFKNLLSVIVWTSDIVTSDPAAGPLVGDLDEIREAASRGVDLAQQLLTFARRDEALPEPIDVGAELFALAELLRRTLGDHIGLDLQIDPDLPSVRVNRSRFDQAIVNLAVNARDAMGAGGRVVVEACEHHSTGEPGLDAGPYVVVAVSDSGSGMEPEVARRAMEPFYTTKEPGQGTGLGLAIVHGIVTSAGGAVRISAAPGRGTTVRLLLPASEDPSPTAADVTAGEPPLGAGEVVLVVEDDDPLRALVQRMLETGNYTAVGAADPTSALALAADPDQRLDVVLTDLLMPGMSGADLAARLGDKRPSVPVIYMSAYTADILEQLVEAGASPVVLEKPFTQRQLLEAVHEALSRSGAASGR